MATLVKELTFQEILNKNTEIFPTLKQTNLGMDLLSAWPQLNFEGKDWVQRAWRRTDISLVVS